MGGNLLARAARPLGGGPLLPDGQGQMGGAGAAGAAPPSGGSWSAGSPLCPASWNQSVPRTLFWSRGAGGGGGQGGSLRVRCPQQGRPLSVEGRAERRLSPDGHRLSKCNTGTGVREVWSRACKSPLQEQVVGRAQRAAPEQRWGVGAPSESPGDEPADTAGTTACERPGGLALPAGFCAAGTPQRQPSRSLCPGVACGSSALTLALAVGWV